MGRKKTALQVSADAIQLAQDAQSLKDEADEDGDEERVKLKLGPLFLADEIGEKSHVRTRIARVEPVDEGTVGDLTPDSGEAAIFRKWGGGGFDCQAVGADGQVIKRRTIRIGGEPRFDNDLWRRTYEAWKRERFPEEAAPMMIDGSPIDPVALEEARHNREIARIRAEAEVAVAKAKAEADSFLARAKAEAEASISKARQERAEAEEVDERRRRKEREERKQEREEIEAREDTRRRAEREERRAEREEREEREDKRLKAELELRREEMSHRADPIAQFGSFASIIANLQGAQGGPEDPVTAMVTRLPEILQQVRETGMAMTIGSGAKKQQAPTAQNGFDPNRGDVALTGEIAQKAQRAIVALQKAGVDPELALAKSFDALATARPAPKPPQQAPRNAPPPQKLPPQNGARPSAPVVVAEVVAPEPGKA